MLYEASSLPAFADFSSQRGDNWQQYIYLITNTDGVTATNFDFHALPNDVKIDTVGIKAKMTIRKGGRYVCIITNNGLGGIVTDRGRIKLSLTAEQTQELKPEKYQYELRLTTPSGNTITYLKGYFRIVVDQDQLIEDQLIVGNLEKALLLSTSKNAVATKPTGGGASQTPNTEGSLLTRCFFKAPNGNFFIQYIDNNGTPRLRRDDPTRYPSTVIFLQPMD
jgi:hypothetical protein